MGYVSFVHIGDVHYPEWSKPNVDSDIKDTALGPAFLQRVGPSRLRQALDAIVRLIEDREDIVGLLLAGDLTDKAKLDGYRACVEYFEGALGSTRLWRQGALFVVPGNHDVDRSAADPATRVARLSEVWVSHGLDVLTTTGVRSAAVEHGGNTAVVYTLNSCIGCGEKRRLPEGVRDELSRLLDGYVSDQGGLQAAFDVVGEQLDTPAFDQVDLETLTGEITRLPSNEAPLVLAHHGILPQGLFRADLYTEVINGGAARLRFRDLEHPVIYCHGHIHENPIEVLRDPKQESRPVVLVSAPLLRNGFNVISVAFGRDRSLLGVKIDQYTIADYGGIQLSTQVRVPLVETGSGELLTDELGELVGKFSPMEGIRFTKLVQHVIGAFGSSATESDVRDRVEELEWLGTIHISGRGSAPHRWVIRRVRP